MKEESREMQEHYAKQADDSSYRESREKGFHADRQNYEKSLELMRRTAKGGTVAGRKPAGVTVLSGNDKAVFSDTKKDGTRDINRPSGIVFVNEEASKLGAPTSPGKALPWHVTSGSETTHEGEQ